MRFFVSPNIKSNPPLYFTVVLFLLSSLLYWIINWFFYAVKFGIDYRSMYAYFFIDPKFPERIPFSQLLEDLHIQFFLHIMFLIVLSSLFLQGGVRGILRYILPAGSFLSATVDVLLSLAVYFLSPAFIYPKILTFLIFQASSGLMLFLTLKSYLGKGREGSPDRSLLYSIVLMFAVSSLIFALINLLLFLSKMGLTPESIAVYYIGDPGRFIKSRSLEGIVGVVTPHTIGMGVYLTVLVHFSFFTGMRRQPFLSLLTLPSGIGNNLSPLLIRFLGPEFSYLKLLSFLLLTASMVFLSTVVGVWALKRR